MEFHAAARVPADAEVLGVPVASDDLDAASAHIDLAFLAERGFDGRPGETIVIPGNGGPTVIAVGVGSAASVTADDLRWAAAAFVRRAWRYGTGTLTLLDAVPPGADRARAAQAIAEGCVLGAYQFTRHKSEPQSCSLGSVTVVGSGGQRLLGSLERGRAVGEAVCLARDLANEPASMMTPRDFAAAAIEIGEREQLAISVLDEVDIEAAGLGGMLGVARGSVEPARLVQLTYEPAKASRTSVALVGKGITFDSGGLSLKTADGMMTMKTDMSGAAAVLATMSVLRPLGVKSRVVGFMPLAENMPSGTAIKPGDVLRIRNGRTVEVVNTDAEGRLVLADALCLAVEEQPDAILDIATLTGHCPIALGPSIAGLLGNHDPWVAQVHEAASRAGELVWPLPLHKPYRRYIDSEIADVRNSSRVKKGGTLTAALFLSEFVGDVPWAHLDIAGPARIDEDDGAFMPMGGTGFGVRTLIETVASFKKPARS